MHFGVQARALDVDECVDDAKIIHDFKYCRFGGFRYKRITCQDGTLAKGYDMKNKPALLIVQLITTRNVTVRSDYQKLDYKKEEVEKWVAGFPSYCW
jgi:hypothetical protein